MINVIPPHELERRRLIRKIDHYILRSVAAGLITVDELKELKQKVRDKHKRQEPG